MNKIFTVLVTMVVLFVGCGLVPDFSHLKVQFEKAKKITPDTKVVSGEKIIGKVTSANILTEGVMVEIELSPEVRVPKKSVFEIVRLNLKGDRVINVNFSQESEFYTSTDTIIGSKESGFKNAFDKSKKGIIKDLIEATEDASDAIIDELDEIE